MFAQAPPGSLIVGATPNFPDAYRNYDKYPQQLWLSDLDPADMTLLLKNAAAFLTRPKETDYILPPAHVYVVLTRAQEADAEMDGLLPPGAVPVIEKSLAASPRFKLILQNADGSVFEELPAAGAFDDPARSALRHPTAALPTAAVPAAAGRQRLDHPALRLGRRRRRPAADGRGRLLPAVLPGPGDAAPVPGRAADRAAQ